MTSKEITVAIKLKDQLSAQLVKVNKGMGKSIKALASHWKAFAIAGAAATGAVVGFTVKAVQAANQQELAERKLMALLGNVRDERDKTIDSLKAQAEALQKVTKFEDAEILNAQAMLASFQLTKKQITEITPRMLDMAASIESVTGQQANLQQISIALGKGFTGMVGQLGRYGVILSDATKKSGEFADIIADLDMNFKGAAIAAADTFGGKLTILKNQFGEVMEEVGKVITKNETLTRALVEMSHTFGRVARYVGENADTISKYVATMAVHIVKAVGFAVEAWANLRFSIQKVTTSIGRIIGIFNKNWKEAARVVEEENRKAWKSMTEIATTIQGFAQSLEITIPKIKEFAGHTGGPDKPNIPDSARKAVTALDQLKAKMEEIYKVAGMPAEVEIKIHPPEGAENINEGILDMTEAFLDMTDVIESGTSRFVGSFLGEIDAMSDLAKYHFTDIAEQFAQMIGKMIIQALALKAVKMIFGGPLGFLMGEGGIIGRPEGVPAQEGLMVYGPTRVIAGERGPEVIFPLEKMRDIIRTEFQASRGGGGGGNTVIVYANDVRSVAESFRSGALGRALKQVTGEGHRIVNTRGIGT